MNSNNLRIDEILSKKEVHDLNINEKKEIIEILLKMNSETDINYIEYLVKFPPDVGIFAFVKKNKKLNFEDQKQKIYDLFLKAKNKKIKKFQVIKRGLALIEILVNEKIDERVIWFTINILFPIINEFSGKKLKASTAGQFYKLFVQKSHELLFKLNISNKFLSKIEFRSLFDLFINMTFFRDKDLSIDPKIQFGVLNWFAKADIEFEVDDIKGISIKHYINKWPANLINKIKLNIEIIDKFDPFISDILKSIEDDKSKSEIIEDDNIINKENLTSNDNNKQKFDLLSELIMVSKSLNKIINITKNQLDESEELKNKCFKLENNNKKLKTENNNLNINLDSLVDEKKILEGDLKKQKIKISDNNNLIEDLESKNKSNKLIIESLHKSSELGKNNLLEDYKNKITFRLKAEYADFMSIREKEISKDLGNNLKTQLDNVFSELKRNGIKLQ